MAILGLPDFQAVLVLLVLRVIRDIQDLGVIKGKKGIKAQTVQMELMAKKETGVARGILEMMVT